MGRGLDARLGIGTGGVESMVAYRWTWWPRREGTSALRAAGDADRGGFALRETAGFGGAGAVMGRCSDRASTLPPTVDWLGLAPLLSWEAQAGGPRARLLVAFATAPARVEVFDRYDLDYYDAQPLPVLFVGQLGLVVAGEAVQAGVYALAGGFQAGAGGRLAWSPWRQGPVHTGIELRAEPVQGGSQVVLGLRRSRPR